MIKYTGYVLKPDGIEYADIFIINYDTISNRVITNNIIDVYTYMSDEEDDLLYWLNNDFDEKIKAKDRCNTMEDAQKQIIQEVFNGV